MYYTISYHLLLQRLSAYYEWVSGWSIIGGRKNLPVVSGWLQAISGLQVLVHETLTEHSFSFLLTGRFNQDAIEVIIRLSYDLHIHVRP